MGDTLRIGGFLVSPVEIETHLAAHPAIDGAQVVAVRQDNLSKPYAFLILASGVDYNEADVRQHCLNGLAKFKVPIAFHVISEFPTTKSANGTKIQRTKLRDMAQAALASG